VKFGSTPLEDAAGRILAHTLRLPDGGILRKGRVLDEEDVARLQEAGLTRPVTALLDADELGEDEAARRLAQAVAGPGIRVEPPRLGRANLVAEGQGLARVDPDRVAAVNRQHEGVQVATLPPWAQVHPGTVVASVKVVPFGVPEAAIRRAEALEGSEIDPSAGPGRLPHRGAVAVAPFRVERVGLVLTRFPQTKERALELAGERVATRVRERGGRVLGPRVCGHEAAPLAEELRALAEDGAEVLLVFGASATLDREDVLPAAIDRAGGAVIQLGMPVDPGNLLLLAELHGRPTVGVPGCARSPRPSGFDPVLDRLMAGLELAADDLAAMGVGGLLRDTGDRPEPRTTATPGPRVAGLVLAAGSSTRMGEANKLLLEVEGEAMVRRVARTAREAGLDPVVVVTGHEGREVAQAVADLGVETVENPNHREGLSTSLAAGLAALPEDHDAAAVLLGDMPFVRPETIQTLVAAHRPETGASICVPVHRGKRGNPVLWARRHWTRMQAVEGDRGARTLLLERAEEVEEVEVDDPGVLRDVDHPGALPTPSSRD